MKLLSTAQGRWNKRDVRYAYVNRSSSLCHSPSNWSRWLESEPEARREKSITLSVLFQIQYRLNKPNVLLRRYRWFQEYHCVMHAKVENQKLLHIQQNHQTLRKEKHRRICEDVITANNQDDIRSEIKVILPPSFIGSPIYIHQHFQNAIAIARAYHKPDLFITFTCNPQWQEITHSLLPNQHTQDMSDIVARVFNYKRKKLMNDLINGNVMWMWWNSRREAYPIPTSSSFSKSKTDCIVVRKSTRLSRLSSHQTLILSRQATDGTGQTPGEVGCHPHGKQL